MLASGSGAGGADGAPADGSGAPGESSASHRGITPPTALSELESVARIMRRYRLDSVEMLPDGGIKVLKTTHRPLVERGPSPEDVSEAVERRLEAFGLVNATEDSGRIPLDEEAIMFAASRAPALSVDEFRPQTEAAEDLTDEG